MAAVDLNGSWNHSWRAALSFLIVLGYRTVVFLGVLHGLRYLQHCTITTLEKAVFFTDASLSGNIYHFCVIMEGGFCDV